METHREMTPEPDIDPPGDPTGDERVLWAAKVVCWCALGTLVLLLLSLLPGCANNIDRALWRLLE
jgi:hypothetical protein